MSLVKEAGVVVPARARGVSRACCGADGVLLVPPDTAARLLKEGGRGADVVKQRGGRGAAEQGRTLVGLATLARSEEAGVAVLDNPDQIWVRIGPCWGLLLCYCTLSMDKDRKIISERGS